MGGDGAFSRRARSAEQAFARYQPLMKPAGITRIADVTGLDVIGIPVSLAIRPAARSLVVSAGKGLTVAGARVAALMESLECWYAENLDLPAKRATFDEVGDVAVNPESLPPALGADTTTQRSMDWIAGTDLATGRTTWVPLDSVNVKLLKLGGLLPAKRELETLRGLGAARFLGCHFEPERSIAYAAQLAGLCDWTDLDGHFWLGAPAVDSFRLDTRSPGIARIATEG